jgi:hypothetical protein
MRAVSFLAAVGMAAGLLAVACARAERHPAELRVETSPVGADTKLTLVAGPGLKINARLKPALELPDGTVLRFDSTQLTSDSAYFTEPPSALLAGRLRRLKGTLRASVCGIDEQVCRSITLEI